jgi:hypothetical protein
MPIDQKELDGEDSLLKIKRAIPLEALIEKLNAELDAEERKLFQHEGKVTDERDVIAWGIRQKARQDAHKLRGDYPSEKVEHTVSLEDKLRAIHEKREKED